MRAATWVGCRARRKPQRNQEALRGEPLRCVAVAPTSSPWASGSLEVVHAVAGRPEGRLIRGRDRAHRAPIELGVKGREVEGWLGTGLRAIRSKVGKVGKVVIYAWN